MSQNDWDGISSFYRGFLAKLTTEEHEEHSVMSDVDTAYYVSYIFLVVVERIILLSILRPDDVDLRNLKADIDQVIFAECQSREDSYCIEWKVSSIKMRNAIAHARIIIGKNKLDNLDSLAEGGENKCDSESFAENKLQDIFTERPIREEEVFLWHQNNSRHADIEFHLRMNLIDYIQFVRNLHLMINTFVKLRGSGETRLGSV